MPSIEHTTLQYENNAVNFSRQPTQCQERQMRRFRSQGGPDPTISNLSWCH